MQMLYISNYDRHTMVFRKINFCQKKDQFTYIYSRAAMQGLADRMDQELTGFRFDDGQIAALNKVPPKIDCGTLTCASNAVVWSITALYYHPNGPKRGFGQIEIACVRRSSFSSRKLL